MPDPGQVCCTVEAEQPLAVWNCPAGQVFVAAAVVDVVDDAY